MAILNGITNAFVSNLMGDSFSTQMKEFVKGFLCGFGLYSFAYFINAIYAISVLEILVVDVLAREASSAVMIVVSACDGDSSNVVKYEMQAAMYMLASVLLYRGTLPKNDMKPSKNGWNCDVENAGLAKVGADFGKMGIYVENPNITVDWSQYAVHAMERMQKRGMTKETVDQIVLNGKTLSQDNGNKFVFITQKGVAVVSKNGKLITAWSSNNFHDAMREIIKRLFGE